MIIKVIFILYLPACQFSHFIPPETKCFLVFSGDIKWRHWPETLTKTPVSTIQIEFLSQVSSFFLRPGFWMNYIGSTMNTRCLE